MTSIPLGPNFGKAPDGGLTAGMQSGPCCCQGLRSCPEAQGSGRFFLHPLPGWRTIELHGSSLRSRLAASWAGYGLRPPPFFSSSSAALVSDFGPDARALGGCATAGD